jgi:hypothetical protein
MEDSEAGKREGSGPSRLHKAVYNTLEVLGTGGASILTGDRRARSERTQPSVNRSRFRKAIYSTLEAFATGGASILTGGRRVQKKDLPSEGK